MIKKRIFAGLIATLMVGTMLTGCSDKEDTNSSTDKATDNEEKVVLNIVGPWGECKALEDIAADFNSEYPNCRIEYEYIQNYEESLNTRFGADDPQIDAFLTETINEETADLYPYTEELLSHSDELDLSNTYEGLIKNALFKGSDKKQLYSIPLGGELRGMYVNTTLLDKYNLKVPTNKQEFLDDCKVLADNGYIPVQGNPGRAIIIMAYPQACNIIANADNYDEIYKKVNDCEAGISKLFEEPMQTLYTLSEKKYYNYKYIETECNRFTDTSDEGTVRDFLGIVKEGEEYEKKDDIGEVAFMPDIMSLGSAVEKAKEDYHSNINYKFILSPMGDDSGYAYLSPSKGIAVAKKSKNKEWTLKFINYLFKEENNKKFAKEQNIVPNTMDAFDIIKDEFDVDSSKISQVGQVTFDYNFYQIIWDSFVETAKSNNPKYMKEDGTMYDFNYYMNNLEDRFTQQRIGSEK